MKPTPAPKDTPQSTSGDEQNITNVLEAWVREKLAELDPNAEFDWDLTFDSNDKGE